MLQKAHRELEVQCEAKHEALQQSKAEVQALRERSDWSCRTDIHNTAFTLFQSYSDELLTKCQQHQITIQSLYICIYMKNYIYTVYMII